MKMFRFDESNKSFAEDESLRLQVAESDEINSSEFDRNFEHIFIVKNLEVIEKRRVGESGTAIEFDHGTRRFFYFSFRTEKRTKWK